MNDAKNTEKQGQSEVCFERLVRVRVVELFLTDSPLLKDLKLSCGHTKLGHPIRGNKIPKTVVCWDCSRMPA